jgi:hypothetical protein
MARRVAAMMMALLMVSAAAVAGDDLRDFIARHWRLPLAPQGPAPPRFTAIEASLQPEACGACHPAQFADWKGSLHAKSIGPGVAGQLVDMLETDPASAISCYRCHAPLAEQVPLVRVAQGFEKNPVYDPALRDKGIPCAACHVRTHQRFGPPKRDGSLATDAPPEALPHGGVTRTPAFLRSEFCAGCHQFEPGVYALNGKLLENTYNEWRASRYAREGVQCQDCHMPDRRHLWRGIHDRETVARGVAVTLTPAAPRPGADRILALTLRVQNTGVGHAFPTYVTPRVVMRVEQVDAADRTIAGTRVERTIERAIELDLSREIRDTRLLPGQAAALEYRRRADANAVRARVSVIVEPDAFYERFFEAILAQEPGHRGAAQLREALADTRRSPFSIFERDIPLGR